MCVLPESNNTVVLSACGRCVLLIHELQTSVSLISFTEICRKCQSKMILFLPEYSDEFDRETKNIRKESVMSIFQIIP